MFLRTLRCLLVVLVLALLAPWATRFYYPTFRKQLERQNNFLSHHQADMVNLNAITGTELTQLQTLKAAMEAIVTSAAWPKYNELG